VVYFSVSWNIIGTVGGFAVTPDSGPVFPDGGQVRCGDAPVFFDDCQSLKMGLKMGRIRELFSTDSDRGKRQDGLFRMNIIH